MITQIDRHAYLETAPLRPGDQVAMIAPAGPRDQESVERAVQQFRDWGLRVVVGSHVGDPHPRAPYLAGPDDGRRVDLVEAWCDPEIDAVVSLGGGYGSMRLLDELDWDAMRHAAPRRDGRPTLLTGSSDITALHEAFRYHLDVPTLFSPMAANQVFADSEAIRTDVHRWLFEPWRGRDAVRPEAQAVTPGRASGRLTGGCLALLAGGLGSPESTGDHRGLLVLEDVGEEIYRLDGFLLALRRAGRLASATGIALGSWQDCTPPDGVRPLLEEYVADLGIPVIWDAGFGHHPDAASVPLNVDAELVAGDDVRLTIGGGDHA